MSLRPDVPSNCCGLSGSDNLVGHLEIKYVDMYVCMYIIHVLECNTPSSDTPSIGYDLNTRSNCSKNSYTSLSSFNQTYDYSYKSAKYANFGR